MFKVIEEEYEVERYYSQGTCQTLNKRWVLFYNGDWLGTLAYNSWQFDGENNVRMLADKINKLCSPDTSHLEKIFIYKDLTTNRAHGCEIDINTESKYINKQEDDELGKDLFDLFVRNKLIHPFESVNDYYTNELIRAIPLKELL